MTDFLEIPAIAPAPSPQEALLRNGIASAQINGATEIRDNTIFAKKIVIGQQTWTHNLVWSATDYNTAAWTSGTIYFSDGTSYSIDSGNTGNISATTYIYFDKTSTLKTSTTYSDAVGNEKILLAIVYAGETTGYAIIQVFGAIGTTIDGDKIITGKIQSSDGKTYWDLDLNKFVMSDASNPRLAFGNL